VTKESGSCVSYGIPSSEEQTTSKKEEEGLKTDAVDSGYRKPLLGMKIPYLVSKPEIFLRRNEQQIISIM
jgi:hypothetical protein